ncbi:MAG TPA: sensor histidine kinase [Verrucomicrobiae bacterium]|nr:sensor histidine kinase [Verrucomicrobiae bacterium]
MTSKLATVVLRYRIALEGHLRQGVEATYESARLLGRQAATVGLHPLRLAKLHEQLLVTRILPRRQASDRPALVKRAGTFLGVAITQSGGKDGNSVEAARILKRAVEALSVRTLELAASNSELTQEIAQRRLAEKALTASEKQNSESLERSFRLEEQMRGLSRQLLSAHEDERRRISRELHDVIAQTLTGINIRLATLSIEAAGASKGLDRKIARTHRLVEHSVDVVHQFARELRPTVLDDLGLIPALHSFLKSFTVRTGIHARLTVFAAVEHLDMGRRTVLFRVAQEALTNVGRHSGASNVAVTIERVRGFVRMHIKDDGKSFDAATTLKRNRGKRLGLLGMRERVEMVGGTFAVLSAPREGVTVTAQISIPKRRQK